MHTCPKWLTTTHYREARITTHTEGAWLHSKLSKPLFQQVVVPHPPKKISLSTQISFSAVIWSEFRAKLTTLATKIIGFPDYYTFPAIIPLSHNVSSCIHSVNHKQTLCFIFIVWSLVTDKQYRSILELQFEVYPAVCRSMSIFHFFSVEFVVTTSLISLCMESKNQCIFFPRAVWCNCSCHMILYRELGSFVYLFFSV